MASASAQLLPKYAIMAIRKFLGSDGHRWTVWMARSSTPGKWRGVPDEWLVFQNDDDTERRRLLEIPANWESLPDDRLDLLLRVAEPVVSFTKRHSPPSGVDRESIGKADDEE